MSETYDVYFGTVSGSLTLLAGELSATELVRRAERCIVQGVRAGQAAGNITTRSDGGPKSDYQRGGQTVHVAHQGVDSKKFSPSTYIGTGSNAMCMAALADDVSDEQFELALADAKAEGNLSRANVTRNIKGETKPKPADRHEVHHNGRRINPVRIIEETINTLDGVAMGLALIDDIPSLDAAQRQEWSEALRQPLAAINKFNRELK